MAIKVGVDLYLYWPHLSNNIQNTTVTTQIGLTTSIRLPIHLILFRTMHLVLRQWIGSAGKSNGNIETTALAL